MRGEPLNSSMPVPRFQSGGGLLNHTGGTCSRSGMIDYTRFTISEMHAVQVSIRLQNDDVQDFDVRSVDRLENSAKTTDILASRSAVKNHWKVTVCKTDNFVPLVVSGLSTSSGSNSSSTSTSQDLSTTSPAQERCDELAPREWCGSHSKTPNKKKKRDGSRDADDSLRDLPEWLEEFTDNPEDTEVHAPAHISQDSDSESPTKAVSKSGVLKLTSSRTEIATSARGLK